MVSHIASVPDDLLSCTVLPVLEAREMASLGVVSRRFNGLAVSVVFLIDGSGSVNAEEFEAMLGFVVDASTQLQAAVPNNQVSVVQFSNDVRVEVPLAAVDLDALRKTTKEMSRMNGGTNVAVALQKAGSLLKRDAGLESMRHVVLLTDGRVDSYQAHEARQVAEQLADEQRHVSLFAYGVGRGVDRAELLHIIGGPPTCPMVSHAIPAPGGAAPDYGAGGGPGGDAPGAGGGVPVRAGPGVCLSAWGEEPDDRYLALYVRDEAPW
ncbi:hypothetical protein GPECTOR_8g284 [Gonium pectorale]|uniref:VWFA domain-containing protein n=1 Tax=Gonium pectorale TaxID=33097 RepID=A0A150GSS5_GONPE|nr:hypothetical protein GPECTOR_8g284 [Gonium pectorale]|eukprot:KXZ52905.1 hypothetical protein GPECTOR_8g284 [Gonium pectorale]